MVDRATPNLPSRDLDATTEFYAALGFAATYRDPGWLILERGGLVVEFFPDPRMDPASTATSCCLRVDDVDELYAACVGPASPRRTSAGHASTRRRSRTRGCGSVRSSTPTATCCGSCRIPRNPVRGPSGGRA